MKLLRLLISVLCLECCLQSALSQQTPYHLNGDAYKEDCNCYTLTPAVDNKSGSIWNINKIDLTQPFDYKFNIYLGCVDADGADGIVFVLQPISTSIGSLGGGIGYEGVSPSIGITIDTWQNSNNSDPSYDHIAIHKNGDINHTSPNNLAGPVTALAGKDDIEDCQWHTLRIIWNPATNTLQADVDGIERVKANIDLVGTVFSGDPKVFWGFTAATGGSNNHQRICTSLNPGFTFPVGQVTCYPTPIQFIDSSASFGSILKWYWDFGDGTTDSINQTPVPHVYPGPGNYEVSLKILGNNGCVSDTFKKTVIAGSEPEAAFDFSPPIACQNTPLNFKDLSKVQYGTINSWSWDLAGQSVSVQNPVYVSPSAGTIPVQLKVKTKEGCVSDLTSQTVKINPIPRVDFRAIDVCADTAATVSGINLDPAINITQWTWQFGEGQKTVGINAQHIYSKGGDFKVSLIATAENGCTSVPVEKPITVFKTRAFAGYDTIAAQNQSITLQASGEGLFIWSPASGLSDPTILNPVATLQRDAEYILKAYTIAGCENTDTVRIKVYKGPDFYVPNAFTPNGDEKNDHFRCLAVGMASIDFFNVYNRYGQLVFSSASYRPGWDGTVRGIKQPAGTYVWMVRGKDFTGKTHMKKGTVTLVR